MGTGASGGSVQAVAAADERVLERSLAGAERVTESLSEKLGIKVGETDASGMFTLVEFECLGACDRAPVMMVTMPPERIT